MSKVTYSDEELKRYFDDRNARHASGDGDGGRAPKRRRGLSGYFHRLFADPRKAQAAHALTIVVGLVLLGVLGVGIYTLTLFDELPTFEQLDNPELQLATVAYTADGEELARYAFQNRSWVSYDEISPHVINALIATEDIRFYEHWGVDLQGIAAAVADIIRQGDLRGASTISQQLARNLYNDQIGRQVTPERKLKEMVTAVELERRYTKREIIEMYLNTVAYIYNAFGIEAAARTFFNKPASQLDELESATLVGMLQNPVLYDPVRFPDRSMQRRNTVVMNMVRAGFLPQSFADEHLDDPIETDFHRSEITASFAPYFAEYVRNWTRDWANENGFNLYSDGLIVHTTLDSRLQEIAHASVQEQMNALQKVVDYEWSRPSNYYLGGEVENYANASEDTAFDYFWSSKDQIVNSFVQDTDRYRALRERGVERDAALRELRANEAFMDSLKIAKTRLEAGLVSIDPTTGYVKAWVGGRDLATDWYDHVATAKRQPGSTFKPFVYTAAIDNGYSPYYRLPDSSYTYVDPSTGEAWRPGNFGGASGDMLTLREALATSNNLITAQVITKLVNPSQVAFYARRMGIESELDEVPALGLGTSDVSLLEMVSAYGTLASGGLHYDPTVVTRIEDRYGNVLYEAEPVPEEALSEKTAYTVVDMMRGVIHHPRGTGVRIRYQYGLGDYDLAAKTGTTQSSGTGSGGSDGWFILMHPQLVTGAWVGFNDRRINFRTSWWGQGAHNALFLVGDFFKTAVDDPEAGIENVRFPSAATMDLGGELPLPLDGGQDDDDRRVGW